VLLLVEGPDGTGKSTLVNDLEKCINELYPSDYVHVYRKGPPREHPLDEYESKIIPYRPGRGEHIICDRWHLGELVYPKVFGRKTEMTPGVFAHIEMLLQSRGALLINTYRLDVDDHAEQLMQRDDIDVNPDMLPSIRDGFRDAVHFNTQLTTIDHDYERCSYISSSDCAASLISAASKLEQSVMDLNEFVTYVGSPRPSLLILGDVRHNTDPKTNQSLKPTFMPYKNTSGFFLMEALHDGGFTGDPWRAAIGIANANDVDNPVRLWHRLGQPHVIALGKNSSRNLHVPHSNVPHPQFIRRFHSSARTDYGRLLRNASTEIGDYSAWRP
jgi:hypothetical protein